MFLLAMIGESFGRSQRAPSGNPPVQGPSTHATQQPATEQRGTDQVPLTVKILPSPDSEGQADKQERERTEKAETDKRLANQTQRLADETKRLADDTSWLAIITGFLFVAALGQISLFYWQLKLIRGTIELARAEIVE